MFALENENTQEVIATARRAKRVARFLFTFKNNSGTLTPCCRNGEVEIVLPKKYPPILQNLLASTTDKDSKDFRKYIRKYNRAFSFATLKAKTEQTFVGKGPPVQKGTR